jgi:hypothetical protein
MICLNCSKKNIDTNAKFCSHCGYNLNVAAEAAISSETSVGNGNISIGVGHGNNVNIGQINANLNTDNTKNTICYTKIPKKKLFKSETIKNTKNLAMIGGGSASILAIISSTMSIINEGVKMETIETFNKIAPVSMIILALGFLIHIYYRDLVNQGFLWIKPNQLINILLDINSDGIISSLDIKGTCYICNGEISLYKNKNGAIVGYCKKNSDHRFSFDHTNFKGKSI